MNTVCIITKKSTPEKVGGKTQGVASTSKSRGNAPLSTRGSMPVTLIISRNIMTDILAKLHQFLFSGFQLLQGLIDGKTPTHTQTDADKTNILLRHFVGVQGNKHTLKCHN